MANNKLLLFPLLVILLCFRPISSTMEYSEKELLFSIMDSMSSDRDWRSYTKPDPCNPTSSWPGLECKLGPDNHFHVTKLVFGTLPNPTCGSSATFPSQIFSLSFLQSVHFLNCFNTRRTALFFPGHPHASLQQISLRGNPALAGAIPPQISSLKSLQVLTLSQNRLRGEIPDSISLLSSLIHVDLSYNSLTGAIPAKISKLRNLVDLDLSFNALAGAIPASIGELGLLQKLDLSSNALTGSIPQTVEKLKFLTFLALSDNKLTGYPTPATGLASLQNLQYLIMDSNPMFSPLPPELGRLQRLQELKLANSGYSGKIPGSFTGLRNLTALSLENNHLSGEIPPGIGELSRIYHLNLSRNSLGGVVPFSSDFLRRLGRNLDLSGNSGLCFNGGSLVSGEILCGIGICGSKPSSSSSNVQKPLVSSSVVLLYWAFGHVGFNAVFYLCLCLL